MKILSSKYLNIFILLIFVTISSPIDHYIVNSSSAQKFEHILCHKHNICYLIDKSVPFITFFIVFFCIFILIIPHIFNNFFSQNKTRLKRLAILTLLSLFLGPGLIINTLFKTFWGRSRPYEVIENLATYSPVWKINPDGHTNSSFPSGHASIGFFLGVPLLILGRKKTGLIVGSVCGILLGFIRIIQQAHYFSDVVFSGIFVFLSSICMIKLYDYLSRYKLR